MFRRKLIQEQLEPAVPPWRYKPEPPFLVWSAHRGVMVSKHQFNHLRAAMSWFSRFHVGPIEGRMVAMWDRHMQYIIGYNALDPTQEAAWFGTEIGFALLAEYYDAPTVAIWEMQVHDPNFETPKDVVQ